MKEDRGRRRPTTSAGPPRGTGADPRPVVGADPRETVGVEPRRVAEVEPRRVAEVEPRRVAEVEPRRVAEVEPRRVAGVDEAGRGPLAGPVVAAAVILPTRLRIVGLADSKQLSPEERHRLAPLIRSRAVAWSVAWADCEEIDCLNILEATFLAMRRALMRLPVAPSHVQVDGNRLPRVADLGLDCTIEAIIAGDASEPAISAASILAKTTRDMLMEQLDACYPGFELSTHKGYPTARHLELLRRHGPSPLHRRSFAPIKWET